MAPKLPKRKMTEDEELIDLARRENEMAYQKNLALVTRCMKTQPMCVDLLIRTLRSHGYDLSMNNASAPASGVSPAGKSRRQEAAEKRLIDLRAQSHGEALKQMQGDQADWVPEKYVTLASLSFPLLVTHVLSKIEPQSLSGANIRSQRTSTQQAATKDGCLILVSYSTGLNPHTFNLDGPLQFWPYLWAYLRHCSEMRGNRAASLLLPAAFGNDLGVHSLVKGEGMNVTVKQRFTDAKHLLGELKYEFEDLHIISNHSETEARILSRSDPLWTGLAISQFSLSHLVKPKLLLPAVPMEAHARQRAKQVRRDSIAKSSFANGRFILFCEGTRLHNPSIFPQFHLKFVRLW